MGQQSKFITQAHKPKEKMASIRFFLLQEDLLVLVILWVFPLELMQCSLHSVA